MRLFYDLHLHSCLSPCGDDLMTPANIAGMGKVLGLSVMALTDHNTAKNCPAFFKVCEAYGITAIAGMELSTAEDVHLVTLFPTLDAALAFDEAIAPHRMPIENDPDIYGHQWVMNENDEVIGEEKLLLIAATDLFMGDAVDLVRSYGGVVYPAHIDRDSSGIIAMLGDIPPEYAFTAMEYRDLANREGYEALYAEARGKRVVTSSDAHRLEDIHEAVNALELDLPASASHDEIRRAILRLLQD